VSEKGWTDQSVRLRDGSKATDPAVRSQFQSSKTVLTDAPARGSRRTAAVLRRTAAVLSSSSGGPKRDQPFSPAPQADALWDQPSEPRKQRRNEPVNRRGSGLAVWDVAHPPFPVLLFPRPLPCTHRSSSAAVAHLKHEPRRRAGDGWRPVQCSDTG